MKTDARTRVWMIERCPIAKPPLRRIWTVSSVDGAFDTRREAIDWLIRWRVYSKRYIYRTRQYMPVPKE